jgi:hypothetical protein
VKEFLEGQTLGQFYTVWCKAPKVSTGSDMESIRAKINRRRRELGMEAMKPEDKPAKQNGK